MATDIEFTPARHANGHTGRESAEKRFQTKSESDLEGLRLAEDATDPMMALKWYHPHLTRHAADCMLIDNAPEGAYLLRPGSDGNSYVVSVKLSSSVQHVKVAVTAGKYKFGNSSFSTVEGMRKHFEKEKPVIGGDSGVTVTLKFPYSRTIEESHTYTDIVHHAVSYMLDSSSDSEADLLDERMVETDLEMRSLAVASREGYLTKLGRIRKSWRVRWFVLRNQYLSYYKTKQSPKPINVLDLTKAKEVEYDDSKNKEYSFRIWFTERTYFLYANSPEDCQQWVELLQSKLPLRR